MLKLPKGGKFIVIKTIIVKDFSEVPRNLILTKVHIKSSRRGDEQKTILPAVKVGTDGFIYQIDLNRRNNECSTIWTNVTIEKFTLPPQQATLGTFFP